MRVIVTRPPVSAERTAGRLVARGHTPVLMPLFEPRHFPDAARTALDENHGELVLTSAEAVRSLPGGDSFDRAWLSRPVHAVGQATARAARLFGFRDIRISGGTGETLAAALAAFRDPDAAPFLYIAGEPRSPELERVLAERDIPVRVAIGYRMVPVEPPAELVAAIAKSGKPHVALLYSRETARSFAAVLRTHPSLRSALTGIFCLSEAIADALPPELRPLGRAAPAPNEDSLLALLGTG